MNEVDALIQKTQAEIAHYQEKYEVQLKRIQLLKKENEQLKGKQAEDNLTSSSIQIQND